MAGMNRAVLIRISIGPNEWVLHHRPAPMQIVSGGGLIVALRAISVSEDRTEIKLLRVDTDPYADLMVEASPGIDWAYFRRNHDGSSTIVGNPLLFPDPNDPWAPFTQQQLELLAEEQAAHRSAS